MKAVKANKEYIITEQEKARYQKDGFDIIDDNGSVIAYGKGKTVPYEQYIAVLNELNALKSAKKTRGKAEADKEGDAV